jgi:hypothetical protein
MKTEVYSWRLSAARKADLENEARREGTSVAKLLEQITAAWLAQRRDGHSNDDAEQAALRKRVMATVGTIRSEDPTRSQRTSELLREIIYKKHIKESDALKRRVSRRPD